MARTEGVHLRYDRLKQMPYFLLPYVLAFVWQELAGLLKPQIQRRFPWADAKDRRHIAAADGNGDGTIWSVCPYREPGLSVHARSVAQYFRRRHQ